MKFIQILLLCVITTQAVFAIEFSYDLPVKKIACFGDSLGSLIAVTIKLYSPNTKYQFSIYDPEGKLINTLSDDAQINRKVAFVTDKEGNFQYCFKNLHVAPIKVKMTYKTGVETKDYSSLVAKEDFKPIDLQVQKMEDMLQNIAKEKRMIARKARYASQDAEEVGFKVIAFSIITLLLMGLLTAFQVVYLKNFFKAKKLI